MPAALAGVADYADGHEEQQRIGVVHAAMNSAALLSYLGSLALRAKKSHAAGVTLGFVGLALTTTSATLGGTCPSGARSGRTTPPRYRTPARPTGPISARSKPSQEPNPSAPPPD